MKKTLSVLTLIALLFAMSGVPKAYATTYATWNPSDKSASITLSNGNLTFVTINSADWRLLRSTTSVTSGKWYWEVKFDNAADATVIGISTSAAPLNTTPNPGDGSTWFYYSANGTKQHAGATTAYGATYTTGDVMGIALDMDAGTITFYKNNVSQGQAFTGITGTIYAWAGLFSTVSQDTANFGATTLTYTPPSGYCAGLADACPSASTPFNFGLFFAW